MLRYKTLKDLNIKELDNLDKNIGSGSILQLNVPRLPIY